MTDHDPVRALNVLADGISRQVDNYHLGLAGRREYLMMLEGAMRAIACWMTEERRARGYA